VAAQQAQQHWVWRRRSSRTVARRNRPSADIASIGVGGGTSALTEPKVATQDTQAMIAPTSEASGIGDDISRKPDAPDDAVGR
jgi:hypothetical protein